MSNFASMPHKSKPRRPIQLSDDVLMPRRDFARDVLGVSDRTVARMNLPTTYVGNVAHVLRDASLRVLAERVRRRNEPQQRRRGR
jgi:hypothetical protein